MKNAKYQLNNEDVVVIIGSGAGGGTLGNALAQKGIDVVCLEAGPGLTLADIENNDQKMFEKLTWLDERISEGDLIPNFPLWTCKTTGGTTVHWTAACPRLEEFETKTRSVYGEIENTNLADWPFAYKELQQHYKDAEKLLGVTGTHGVPMLPANNNYKVMEAGAKKIGYKDTDTNHMAINPEARDGRPGCLELGFCSAGCAVGAKWSTLYTEVPRAEATGHYELRPQSMVTRIKMGANNRVTGVEYIDADGKLREQKARLVCVAGNAVETTCLLLNSSTSEFSNGLANSSDQVGRNYMRHVSVPTLAVMPGEVHMYKGAQIAGVVRDEIRNDPSRGFVGGFQFHTLPFSPDVLVNLTMNGKWGREVTDIMKDYRNMAGLMAFGEDLADPDNRISLHPTKKDRNGLPVPIVRYKLHKNSLAMAKYAQQKSEDLYRSLGATKTVSGGLMPSTHNMGVARMGIDPKTSVTNPWGQTHDIDNLFVSDGSLFPSAGSANPTLTIIALVLRQAKYIGSAVVKGEP